MIALFSFLMVIVISLVIIRVATQALVLTGLSESVAQFQARSALTGTGFPTQEAELVVSHPVRRRIITSLMLLKNAGLATAVSTLVLSFINPGGVEGIAERGLLLLAGLGILFWLSYSRWMNRVLDHTITWALTRWTELRVVDYYTLLQLEEDYTVTRMQVTGESWLANKTLRQIRLTDEGVMVLGIHTQGRYLGVPHADYVLLEDDEIICYGHQEDLEQLSRRQAGEEGDIVHQQAVYRQQKRTQEQVLAEEVQGAAR